MSPARSLERSGFEELRWRMGPVPRILPQASGSSSRSCAQRPAEGAPATELGLSLGEAVGGVSFLESGWAWSPT